MLHDLQKGANFLVAANLNMSNVESTPRVCLASSGAYTERTLFCNGLLHL